MTMITDLSLDLVEEILSKVSLTSLKAVKSTCKGWNTLSEDERFIKKHCILQSAKEFPMFLTFGDSWYNNKRFNLHRIHNIKDLPYMKEISKLHSPPGLELVNQCDGLLLFLAEGNRLVVWNPYLAQTRWIELRNKSSKLDLYAIGYDNNKNHKVLVFLYSAYDGNNLKSEIYDFKSSSWRVVDIIYPKRIRERGVSLKGNSYFVVDGKLLGFDFTREKPGQCMDLPFVTYGDEIPCSCFRGEQLAVLYQRPYDLVIWITTKIEPDAVSWTNLFKVGMQPFGLDRWFEVRSFCLIDKEKKVAVVCGVYQEYRKYIFDYKGYVVGEDGFYGEKIDMQDVFSYVPSWVQIQVPSS